MLNVKPSTSFEELKLPTELGVTVEKATTNTTPSVKDEVQEPADKPAEPTAEPVTQAPAADAQASSEPTAEPVAEPTAEPVAEPVAEPKQESTTVIETTQEKAPVTWQGDKEYTAVEDSNVLYTAVLPEGYALKDGVVLPTINVKVGKKVMAATPRAGKEVSVATADEFKNAITGVVADTIIKLTADIDLVAEGVIVQSTNTVNFTIDLNGHKLTSSTTTIKYNGTGMLTITDSVTDGIVETTKSKLAYAIENAGVGTVAVSGGTVSSVNIAIRNTNTGAINVIGGTVSSDGDAIRNTSTGAVTVSGGTVSSINKAINNTSTGTVTVSGGTVSSINDNAIFNQATGTVIVNGTAVVTSAVDFMNIPTIHLFGGTEGQEILKISDTAVVKNTGGCPTIKNEQAGKITVSGSATVTSCNTSLDGGTIYFSMVPTGADLVILNVEGTAQVTNTATPEGYSAYFLPENLTFETVKAHYAVATGAVLGKVSPEKKLVTFDTRNGDTIADVNINPTMTLPADPKWTGYTFDGWYDGIDGTDAAGGFAGKLDLAKAKALTAGIKVYAKWIYVGNTVRTTPLDLTGVVTPSADQGWTWANNTLTLNKLTLDCSGLPVSATSTFGIKLPDNAKIELADGSLSIVYGGNVDGNDTDNGINTYGIETVGNLTVSGKGTLNTNGGNAPTTNSKYLSCGIGSTSAVDSTISINGGTINAVGGNVVAGIATSVGIYTDKGLVIADGAIVNAEGKALTGTNTQLSAGVSAKTLTMTGGVLNGIGGDVVSNNYVYSQGVNPYYSMILSGTAVVTGIGKTNAIECNNPIIAVGASVTNGTADNVGGEFESGVTKILTQTADDKTIPVKISFGPSIAVAAQSGAATYGTAASPTFAVTANSFGGKYPDFAPSVAWTSGSAPTGVTATFTGTNKETLTVNTTTATPAGDYKFKVVSAKASPDTGNYESAEVTLKVGELTANIEWGSTTAFTYNGSVQAPAATVTNAANGDVLTVNVTGGQTNIGTGLTATATGFTGAAAANYAMPSSGLTQAFAITAKEVTVNDGTLEVKKVFDNATTAGAATGKLGLTGVIAAEAANVSVNITTVGAYADATIGKNKTVTLDISLSGTAAGNYTLGSVSTYAFTKAEITKTAYTGTEAAAPDSTPSTKGSTSITLKPVTPPTDEIVEYAVSNTDVAPTADSAWQTSTTFGGLSPNSGYYFFARVKESDKHASGSVSTGTPITTDKAEYDTKPSKPEGTPAGKSDTGITLKAVTPPDGEAVEYGIETPDGNITWQDSTAFSGLKSGTEYKFYTRVKENSTHKAGPKSDATNITTDKAAYTGTEAAAPDASKASKTDTTLTLEAQAAPAGEAIEYGYSVSAAGTIVWQDSTAFTGLSANTEYFFFARIKENDKHKAGAAGAGTAIKTDKVAYSGTQATAPSKIANSKTDTSITLMLQTVAGEAVEYGIKGSDGKITWQDSPAFTSLIADTEYSFVARVKANDKHKAGNISDATIITTKKAPTTVSGNVKDSNGSSLAGANITLTPSNPLLTATTDANGNYTLNNVPAGVYSIVVTKGTAPNIVTITETVTVDGTPVSGKNIQFLDGSKNTVVEATPGAPEISVGGVNDLLSDANITTTLDSAEKAAVEAGGSVEIKVKADVKVASDNTTDKSEIEVIAGSQKIDLLLDLSVLKTVKDSGGNTVTNGERLTTLAGIIKIHLPIPTALQGKAGLSLYRMHDGKAQKLSTSPDASGEYYTIDPSGEFMTLYVKNFSTYALGYNAFTATIANGGTGASGNGNYSNGDTVTINAGSKSGYSFSGWTVTAGTVTLANKDSISTTFTMPSENVTVTAGWTYTGGSEDAGGSQDTYYYINATAGPGGSMGTAARVKVRAGDSAGFTITPDKGYQLADVLVNGKSIGAQSTYVFTNVHSDQTIHATFKKAGHSNPQTGVSVDEGETTLVRCE